QDEEGRAQRDQHVRPQARRLAGALPLVADEAPEHRGDRQAQDDLGDMPGVGQVGEVLAHRVEHLPPPCIHGRPSFETGRSTPRTSVQAEIPRPGVEPGLAAPKAAVLPSHSRRVPSPGIEPGPRPSEGRVPSGTPRGQISKNSTYTYIERL